MLVSLLRPSVLCTGLLLPSQFLSYFVVELSPPLFKICCSPFIALNEMCLFTSSRSGSLLVLLLLCFCLCRLICLTVLMNGLCIAVTWQLFLLLSLFCLTWIVLPPTSMLSVLIFILCCPALVLLVWTFSPNLCWRAGNCFCAHLFVRLLVFFAGY